MEHLAQFVEMIALPKMIQIRQTFQTDKIDDIATCVYQQLEVSKIRKTIKPNMSIAVAVGSRGIDHLALIVKTVIDFLLQQGAHPFIIPAMGSHGGATAQGQADILAGYGITARTMGVPILSDMSVTQIAALADGTPVLIDHYAAESDGIVLINRIKAHTGFRGPFESGLMKMMAIGLGKQKGAELCHKKGFGQMAQSVEAIGQAILQNSNLLFGVALIENAKDEICEIHALVNQEIPQKEPALLQKAKSLMPKIKLEHCDVLIIDEIGKNISGPGADPNITGAFASPYASSSFSAKLIVMLDLTEESHGNANGVGVADVIAKQLFDKISIANTYPNALTSTLYANVKIPMVMPSQKTAIQAAVKGASLPDPTMAKIIRIKNTLCLEHIQISEALLEEAKTHPDITIESDAVAMKFDQAGNLF